ncbi:Tyrosyl-tRNA synthetase [Hordeum vulgare]|nr:Tyrosyl-tRNA synthetase [Hordeum vulgare]
MSKPNEFQEDAPTFYFTVIPLSGIHDVESTMPLFEDGTVTTTTMKQLKENALQASDKAAIKDDASIYLGESEMIEHRISPSVMEASDDVPSLSFIHGDTDEIVGHEIFPSITTVFRDEFRDLCQYIESGSAFTTSPIYDELPQFPCEGHNPHHMSQMSDDHM